MQFLDKTGVGTLWSMCKTKFALAGHTHNSLAAVGNEQISATAYGSGLHFKPYYSSGGPTTYGNILEYTSTNTGGGQLAMEWTGSQTKSDGTDSNVGRIYYRSKRDCINGWTKWMTLAYTNDIPTKLSQLTNDKGFVTGSVSGNTVTINGASTTWTNTWRGIQDNLTSTSTSESLSANQGRILKSLVDGKANSSHTHNYAGSGSAGGSANSAISVVDYGQTSKTIQIGYAGPGITGEQIKYIAGYTTGSGDVNAKIKDVSKDALRSWLGLGTLAYSSATITDNKVTQNAVKSSDYTNWRSLVFSAANSATEGFTPSTTTDGVFIANTLSVQPSSGTIRATKFKGSLEGNASTASNASTVNGHTVNANVPSNAKFTDTNTWRPIQDNLTSTSTSESLSANQGRILKSLVDGKANSSHTHSWSQISDVPIASTQQSGIMSSTDKAKLDGIASGANNYKLPTASANTLGGIKVSGNANGSSWPICVDDNGVAVVKIDGLYRNVNYKIGEILLDENNGNRTEYNSSTIIRTINNTNKYIRLPQEAGILALLSDIPDVSNLCRFNFVNSVSECRSDRINFLLRCPDYQIDLDPFDSYPDGTILLITISNNSITVKHQSGRWFCDGDEVSTGYTEHIYKEGIKLVTKYAGMVYFYGS